MHFLTVPAPLDLGQFGTFSPGSYLVEDRTGAELMIQQPDAGYRMAHWNRDVETNLKDPKSILILGTVGFGDAVLLTPCLRELKRQHPNASIHIACLQDFRQPFYGLPYVDGYAEYPFPKLKAGDYDWILTLEGAVQYNEAAKREHMTDRFANHLGLGAFTDKKPELLISSEERDWIFSSFPKKEGKPRLGIQIQAGVRCRTYPGALLSLVLTALVKAGWEVCMLGRPGEFQTSETPGVVNMSRHGLTWRQSAAFLLTCDCFLGPDSSLLHAAGALDVPAVGLFGPYPWALRTKYYTSVRSIQGTEGCDRAPCFHIESLFAGAYPFDGPCVKTGRCEALASIRAETILAWVFKQAGIEAPVRFGAPA